jgi:hypothetical protein
MASLGQQSMTPQAYTDKITRMTRLLVSVRTDLETILRLARTYDRELVLEVKWAELDRDRIVGMLATLKQETNDAR